MNLRKPRQLQGVRKIVQLVQEKERETGVKMMEEGSGQRGRGRNVGRADKGTRDCLREDERWGADLRCRN